jgi:hypothetical protein
MAVKSILDIDVQDSKFKAFKEQYDRYQAALAKAPGAWKAVNKETAAVGKSFEKMAQALLDQGKSRSAVDDASKKQERSLTRSDQLWTSISKKTKSIAGDVLSATRSLISWTGILSGIGGLLGIGSLFGLDKMGANVSNQRRSSMGLGMSIGQQKAFQTNFSRVVDPDAVLGWVNGIETDPTKAWSAYALGAAPTGNTENDAVRLLKALRTKAQSTPVSQLGLLQQQYGYSGSVEDLRRLKSMSGGEFNQLIAGNKRDIGNLGIDDKVAKKWQDFTTQMERAGSTIFKVFVNGLAPLTGPLEHLSQGVVHFVEILMRKDGIVEQGINKLGGWLDEFAGKLDSNTWQTNFEKFTSSIGDLADLIHTLAHPYDTVKNAATNKMEEFGQWLSPDPSQVVANKENYGKYLGRLESKYALPSGLLDKVWSQESGRSLYPTRNSRAGAKGAFQFMPDTASQYGITNAMDPLQSANGAAKYLFDLEKRYGGNTQRALAAYNWGPGNVDKSLAGGFDYQGVHRPQGWIPGETQKYSGTVNLMITNNTGGNAVVTASQLAH